MAHQALEAMNFRASRNSGNSATASLDPWTAALLAKGGGKGGGERRSDDEITRLNFLIASCGDVRKNRSQKWNVDKGAEVVCVTTQVKGLQQLLQKDRIVPLWLPSGVNFKQSLRIGRALQRCMSLAISAHHADRLVDLLRAFFDDIGDVPTLQDLIEEEPVVEVVPHDRAQDRSDDSDEEWHRRRRDRVNQVPHRRWNGGRRNIERGFDHRVDDPLRYGGFAVDRRVGDPHRHGGFADHRGGGVHRGDDFRGQDFVDHRGGGVDAHRGDDFRGQDFDRRGDAHHRQDYIDHRGQDFADQRPGDLQVPHVHAMDTGDEGGHTPRAGDEDDAISVHSDAQAGQHGRLPRRGGGIARRAFGRARSASPRLGRTRSRDRGRGAAGETPVLPEPERRFRGAGGAPRRLEGAYPPLGHGPGR